MKRPLPGNCGPKMCPALLKKGLAACATCHKGSSLCPLS